MESVDAEAEEPPVHLGFLGKEVHESEDVEWRHSFVGGSPVWIPDVALPDASMLVCGVCGDKLRLLMQIQADTEVCERSLYIMACVRGACQVIPPS
jgi:hypothetical protein